MSKINVAIGAMAGVAAGALIGILFAPDKGTETRNKIAKKSRDTSEALKSKFNEFVDNIGAHFERSKDDISEMKEKSDVN